MARVVISPTAFHDPRLAVASEDLLMPAPELGWRLAFAWSQLDEDVGYLLDVEIVAVCLDRSSADIIDPLTQAGLASERDFSLDLSPLRQLFGDVDQCTSPSGAR